MKKFWLLAVIAITFPILMVVLGLKTGCFCIDFSEIELLWGILFSLILITSLVFVIACNSKVIAVEQEKQTLFLKHLAEKTDEEK